MTTSLNTLAVATALFFFASSASAFVVPIHQARSATFLRLSDIVSPFDNTSDDGGAVATSEPVVDDKGPLELTWENVELVLDGMRHFLIQDGGNVIISEIDGPVVRLELQVS
jgi:hypothetical protein